MSASARVFYNFFLKESALVHVVTHVLVMEGSMIHWLGLVGYVVLVWMTTTCVLQVTPMVIPTVY